MRPVEALLDRIEKDQLLKFYRIADFDNVDTFLGQIARKKGQLQAGGTANMDQAARSVIRDFMNGKLKYWTQPPEINDPVDDDISDSEMEEDSDDDME